MADGGPSAVGTRAVPERKGKPALGAQPPPGVKVEPEPAQASSCNIPPNAQQGTRGCRVSKPPIKYEKLSLEEALRWWPYRPLLRSDGQLPRGKAEEVIIAYSGKVGRNADPRTDPAFVEFIYQYPPYTIDELSFFDLMDESAMGVRFWSFPASSPKPELWGETVMVRKRPAVIDEAYKGTYGSVTSNVDYRTIEWLEPQVDGTTVLVSIASSPRRSTRQQAVDFVERLTELR